MTGQRPLRGAVYGPESGANGQVAYKTHTNAFPNAPTHVRTDE